MTNVEAYLGSSALSRMYLGKLIGTVIERQKCGYNVPIFILAAIDKIQSTAKAVLSSFKHNFQT